MWRLGLATLVLKSYVLTRCRAELARLSRSQIFMAFLSGALLAVHFATWITSLEYTSVITSVVLVTTNPLWVALMSPFLLGEKLTRQMIFSILMATAGGIIISVTGSPGAAPHQDAPLFGAFLAILGAVSFAGYVIIGRRVRASVSVTTYIWMTYGTGALLLLGVVVLAHLPVLGLQPQAYLLMTLLGLGPQLIGHSSYNYALGYLKAAFVSLTVLIEPVGGTILAALLFNEIPVPAQIFGAALIMLSLILASSEEFQRARVKETVETVEASEVGVD